MNFYISVQLLKYGSTTLLWEPDLLLVMEAAEKRGLEELSDEAAQALRLFLTQVHFTSENPLSFSGTINIWNIRISLYIFVSSSQKVHHLTD